MKKVAVLFAPGFEEIEAIAPVDLLIRAGAQVVKIGVGGEVIESARGVKIVCDEIIENKLPEFDAIVIPGGMPGARNLSENSFVGEFIKKHWIKGAIIAAICAAPAVVLSPLGLFSGEEITCYPGFESMLGPEVKHSRNNVVVSGNIITAKAAGKAVSFSLAIIEALFSIETKEKVGESILY